MSANNEDDSIGHASGFVGMPKGQDDGGDAQPVADDVARRHRACDRAREIIALRKRREAALGADLFAEPAWDILLDLFVERVEGRRTSSTSASIAARVPTTTALRYLALLQERGLIVRHVAEHDHRVHYARLSDGTFRDIIDLLAPSSNQIG